MLLEDARSDKALALPGCGPALSSSIQPSCILSIARICAAVIDHSHLMVQVQQLLLEGAWSDKVLALPGCGPALSSSMEVVWVGPRARMGISEAIPSRVVPHTTSGRADYFGPLVNRWVREKLLRVCILRPIWAYLRT